MSLVDRSHLSAHTLLLRGHSSLPCADEGDDRNYRGTTPLSDAEYLPPATPDRGQPSSRGRPSSSGATDAYALTAISSSAMSEAPKSAAASISDFLKGKLAASRQTSTTDSPAAPTSDAAGAKHAAAPPSYAAKPTEQITPKIPACMSKRKALWLYFETKSAMHQQQLHHHPYLP